MSSASNVLCLSMGNLLVEGLFSGGMGSYWSALLSFRCWLSVAGSLAVLLDMESMSRGREVNDVGYELWLKGVAKSALRRTNNIISERDSS